MKRLHGTGVAVLLLGSLLLAGSAFGQQRTFTTDEDFDEGILTSVHHDVADQLQLSEFSETKPFIYIANHRYGTVSKIDTNTGKEVARYPVCLNNQGNTNFCADSDYYMKPHAYCNWTNRGHCPSRTAVDLNGDVWVANRAFGQWASVTKIAGEMGHCVDRNGNGFIDTSVDLNNDGKINVSESETMPPGTEWKGQADECVLFTVKVGATSNEWARALAIDGNNNAWVGMYNTGKAYKLSNSGSLLGTYSYGVNMYGLATDGLGYIYNSDLNNGIIKQINVATGAVVKTIDTPYSTYGIAAESDTQVVWLARWGGNGASLIKVNFAPATPTYTAYTHPSWSGNQTRGVAIDANGNVWVSSWTRNRLAKFTPSTGTWSSEIATASGPIGVGIDSVNRIWTANYYGYNATRYDPSNNTTINSVTIGVEPYSYSDMTGFQLTQGVVTQGTWNVTHDSGVPGIEWGTFTWNDGAGSCPPAGCIPPSTEIKVEVRASDTEPVLTTWTEVQEGVPYTGIFGQYLEVRVTLRIIGAGSVSPVLTDLTVKPANQPPVCQAGSQVNVVCNGGTSTVSLSGAGSSDPEGQPLTYSWTAGTCAALAPQFGTPTGQGTSATVTSAGYCSFGCQFQLTVSDGNSSTTCNQALQMTDEAPVLAGVQGALAECNNGTGGVAATDPQLAAFFADPSAFDSCTQNSVAVTNDAPAVFPYIAGGGGFGIVVAGTNVTFSASDNCQNTVSQIATVTVQDTAGPVAGSCPADDTLVLDALSCAASASYTASATDACTGAVSASHTYSFAGPGSDSYTYTFADGNGNSSSCATQTVTAVDETVPAGLSCPAGEELLLDGSCQASATYTASATDACTGFLSESYTFAFSAPGSASWEYVLADGSGNEVTCSQTVTAVDKLGPADLSCPADDLLYLDGACAAGASYVATATDNCTGLLTDENSFAFDWPGTQTAEYVLADASGNSVGCFQTVQAVDAMAPANLACPADALLYLDAACMASGTYTATATDNCSGLLSETHNFPFHAPGAASWEYVLADAFGNDVSCFQTVQAVDAIPPVGLCNNPPTMLPRDAPITFTATGTDNCGVSLVKVHSYDCTAVNGAGKVISKLGSCVVTLNGGSLTVVDSGGVGDHITWTGTVTDSSGNVTTFSCAIDVINPGKGGGTGCNQGVGNGPEGCDPGNSNQGNPANSNDEKGGVPGNPGKSNNKKK